METLLEAALTRPRFFPLGSDALDLMRGHLARAAERAVIAGERREAALAAALALDWLAAVMAQGLLEDCSDAEIAQAEDEWSCMETEFVSPDAP
jgi:hypothetical protein